MITRDNITSLILEQLLKENKDDEFLTHTDIEDIWNIIVRKTKIISMKDLEDLKSINYQDIEKKVEEIIDKRTASLVENK
jgi:hypothetical protein